jgi:hypothetical protein
MGVLTLNTTKVCDVSKTTIYRANSPTIYARMNDLDFIAYIANQGSKVVGGVSDIYSTMQSMQGKCLRTNQSIKFNFL